MQIALELFFKSTIKKRSLADLRGYFIIKFDPKEQRFKEMVLDCTMFFRANIKCFEESIQSPALKAKTIEQS